MSSTLMGFFFLVSFLLSLLATGILSEDKLSNIALNLFSLLKCREGAKQNPDI